MGCYATVGRGPAATGAPGYTPWFVACIRRSLSATASPLGFTACNSNSVETRGRRQTSPRSASEQNMVLAAFPEGATRRSAEEALKARVPCFSGEGEGKAPDVRAAKGCAGAISFGTSGATSRSPTCWCNRHGPFVRDFGRLRKGERDSQKNSSLGHLPVISR